MRAHVFVVDGSTFPVHRDRCFCGIGPREGEFRTYEDFVAKMLTSTGSGYRGMAVDMLGTRPGDLVFFYERKMGFHGVYRIAGRPFFDSTIIHGVGDFENEFVRRNICLRISIECQHHFPKPVPEDMLFSTPERQALFWVWFYRKIQGSRGCTAIDPEATHALIELLVKVNGKTTTIPPADPYPNQCQPNLSLPLGNGPYVAYEDLLRGWLIQSIDDPVRLDIRDTIGPAPDLEWFANNVPYHVAGRNIDVLAFHSTNRYFKSPIRYQYTVVELKRHRAVVKDVEQLVGYSKWVASRLASGESEVVKPVLIANGFHSQAITKAHYSDWNISLVRYRVEDNDITLSPVQQLD
jgi:hypothetical protein